MNEAELRRVVANLRLAARALPADEYTLYLQDS